MSKHQDLSVAGPYSPVSLKKFIENGQYKKDLTVLIDGTGLGIAHDDPDTIYMTPEQRLEQARWYREECFNGRSVPAYLFRYLYMMFIGDDKKYPTNQSVADAFQKGELTEESEDYKAVVNLIKYSNHNVEAAQIIGFCILLAGTLNQSRKEKKHIRLFIQEPETGLHPKREAKIMWLYYKIQEEYGAKPIKE